MKKIFILISALFAVGLSHAQALNLSTNENYVYSKTYLSDPSLPNPKSVETVQYIDGLGRPKQIVDIKASPSGKDVVTPVEYDPFGRQVKDYLPVPQSGTLNGAIVPNPLANAVQPDVYGSEKIYAEKILENSPLDRIQQQIQVGTDWNNKPVQFDYDANTAGEVIKYTTVTVWENNATKSGIHHSGTYGANQLYKNTVTDEDGNKTIEFKNGRGQILLVRKVLSATENADTYYVYNEYDQLAWVIPPLLSKMQTWGMAEQDALAYEYRYDGRNRLVEKKLPGKGWEYRVYDKADRLIMSQDANLRPDKRWLFTKYDQFSRVIYTGITADPNGREGIQAYVDYNFTDNYEKSGSFTRNGLTVEYTGLNAFPTSMDQLLSVNYYDTYPTGSPAVPTQILGQNVLTQDAQNAGVSTKSLPTASYVKNIEDDNWTKNYFWYDTRGRTIGSYSINHLGGYTKTESELDFSGTPKQVVTRHKRLNSDPERVITETFTYDHQNRLLVHTHQVDNQPVEYLARNEYNELSQLKTKKVGGTVSGNGLQTVDYQYNIRGWLTKINDPANLGSDLFGYKIKYNQVEGLETPDALDGTLKVLPRFNGNIAEVDWKTATHPNDYLRRYGYVYDGFNRLKAGFYQNEVNPGAKEYFEKIMYDLNGNITNLKRSAGILGGSGTAMTIDDLDYSYTGNRLNSVTDLSGQYSGYPDTSGTPIAYDANGNMKDHPDKGLLQIDYNFLNLPNYTVFRKGLKRKTGIIRNNLSYYYRADGVKLKKIYRYAIPNPLDMVEELETHVTEYIDEFQYEGKNITMGGPKGGIKKFITSLQFKPTSEGYFDFVKNKYIYHYTDHLGNVRVSYLHNGSSIEVLEENNYYPFGLKHEGYNPLAGNPGYQYKYNGKELQETEMYDYGARMYMPDIGRWGVVDPLAENYSFMSPYNYTANNPIMFNDPDGMQIVSGEPKLDPNARGGDNNPMPIQEVVINAPLRAIASNPASVMPNNCGTCYYNGGGIQIDLSPRTINPNPPSLQWRGPEPGGGSIMMMGGAGDPLGIWEAIGLIAGASDSNAKYAMLPLMLVKGKGNDALKILNAEKGAFSVADWTGYPTSLPKPKGPFKLLEGAEYEAARKAANNANRALHKSNPEFKGMQIHEVHPVKFGGDPTNPINKAVLTPQEHRLYNTFWFKLQNSINKK